MPHRQQPTALQHLTVPANAATITMCTHVRKGGGMHSLDPAHYHTLPSSKPSNPFHSSPVLGRAYRLSCPLPPFNRADPSMQVIAHRGSAFTHPENTMAAFSAAFASGCRVFETDVQLTADGKLVCSRSADLADTTDSTGSIASLTFRELSDSVHVYGPHGSVDSVALLETALRTFPNASFIVNIHSHNTIEPMISLINEMKAGTRICVAHSWDAWLEDIRDHTTPLLQRSLGWETMREFIEAVREGKRPDPRIHVANWIHLPYSLEEAELLSDPALSQRLITAAHALGIGVRAIRVNDFSEAYRLWNEGVDAISTDHPKQLVRAAHNRHQREQAAKILGI